MMDGDAAVLSMPPASDTATLLGTPCGMIALAAPPLMRRIEIERESEGGRKERTRTQEKGGGR
eukprot:6924325-Pyramimonas_sp.AAC.1